MFLHTILLLIYHILTMLQRFVDAAAVAAEIARLRLLSASAGLRWCSAMVRCDHERSLPALGLRWLVFGDTKCGVAELQHSTIFWMRLAVGLTKRP
jgi:hypothetical protein